MIKRSLLLAGTASLGAMLVVAGLPLAIGLGGLKPALAAPDPAPAKAPKGSLKGKRLCIASPVTIDQLTLFYADMQKAAAQSENGLEITVADAKGDFEKQLAQ